MLKVGLYLLLILILKTNMTIQAEVKRQTDKILVPKKKPNILFNNKMLQYDADLLARMITTEASGSEDTTYDQNEMAAMAHVVLNRQKLGKGFTLGEGQTPIEKIIRGKNQFKGVVDLKDRFDNPMKDHPRKYEMALSIANQVLSGKLPDPTDGATFFNQRKVEGLKPIGAHYFKKYLD